MAILTLGLQNLRRQVNEVLPARDKKSDGWIGDAAHQLNTSGHNPDDTAGSKAAWNGDPDTLAEVRAWDMDSDLGQPGVDAQDVVDHLRALPGLATVCRYMIYNHRQFHSRDGFAPTAYFGPSPHEEHIHFEGAWSQAGDNNTSFDFRLEDLMAVDYDKIRLIIREEIAAQRDETAAAVWAGPLLNVHVAKGEKPSLQKPGDILRYLSPEGKQGRDLTTGVAKDVTALRIDVAKVAGDVAELVTKPPTA
jgi:hypothetical protein